MVGRCGPDDGLGDGLVKRRARVLVDQPAVRERFEVTWVRWNLVRAVVSTAAFGCPAWALALYGQGAAAS